MQEAELGHVAAHPRFAKHYSSDIVYTIDQNSAWKTVH